MVRHHHQTEERGEKGGVGREGKQGYRGRRYQEGWGVSAVLGQWLLQLNWTRIGGDSD